MLFGNDSGASERQTVLKMWPFACICAIMRDDYMLMATVDIVWRFRAFPRNKTAIILHKCQRLCLHYEPFTVTFFHLFPIRSNNTRFAQKTFIDTRFDVRNKNETVCLFNSQILDRKLLKLQIYNTHCSTLNLIINWKFRNFSPAGCSAQKDALVVWPR